MTAPTALKRSVPGHLQLLRFRSSDSLMGRGVEIQPSAEEQDSSSKVSKGAETASRLFQTLNLGVEAFGQGIGDGVSKIG